MKLISWNLNHLSIFACAYDRKLPQYYHWQWDILWYEHFDLKRPNCQLCGIKIMTTAQCNDISTEPTPTNKRYSQWICGFQSSIGTLDPSRKKASSLGFVRREPIVFVYAKSPHSKSTQWTILTQETVHEKAKSTQLPHCNITIPERLRCEKDLPL